MNVELQQAGNWRTAVQTHWHQIELTHLMKNQVISFINVNFPQVLSIHICVMSQPFLLKVS